MNEEKLTRLINDDIAKNKDILKWHGRPLAECLVRPVLKQFVWAGDGAVPSHLWLVFLENKNTETGYKIVYSEEYNEFGLAVAGNPYDVIIGIYGSFIETINSM